MKLLRKTTLAAALAAMTMLPAAPANAVARPAAIDWDAAPAAFVNSLYNGVLGRAPESTAVVATWASSITSNPTSRLNVFAGFVNSPEYRQRFGSTRGTWQLGYRYSGNRKIWAAYRQNDGRWSTSRSNMAGNYAIALAGYYNAYNNRA